MLNISLAKRKQTVFYLTWYNKVDVRLDTLSSFCQRQRPLYKRVVFCYPKYMSQIINFNHHIYWDILCTVTIEGEVNNYTYRGFNKTLEGSLTEAKKNHVWGNHPTFETRVVGIRFE